MIFSMLSLPVQVVAEPCPMQSSEQIVSAESSAMKGMNHDLAEMDCCVDDSACEMSDCTMSGCGLGLALLQAQTVSFLVSGLSQSFETIDYLSVQTQSLYRPPITA